MRYRKKPVVVEAYKTNKEIVIHTLEGDMKASIGDYIITGVNGEKYPCKPDVFEKTYEAVNNTNYDRIKAMSVEELADFIYDAADKICFENCTKDTGNKFQCRFDEDVMPERCVECMKQYLESEAQGNES